VLHRLEWKQHQTVTKTTQPVATPAPTDAGAVTAIMPGKIVDLRVQPGDKVKKGDVVAVLEAMKMENELRATKDGTIRAVHVQVGDDVEQHQVLVEIE